MGTVHIPSRVPQFANAQPHILKKSITNRCKIMFFLSKIFFNQSIDFPRFFQNMVAAFGVAPCSVRNYFKPLS